MNEGACLVLCVYLLTMRGMMALLLLKQSKVRCALHVSSQETNNGLLLQETMESVLRASCFVGGEGGFI